MSNLRKRFREGLVLIGLAARRPDILPPSDPADDLLAKIRFGYYEEHARRGNRRAIAGGVVLLTLTAAAVGALASSLPDPDVTDPLTAAVILAGGWAFIQVLGCLTTKGVRAVLLFVTTAAANAAWSGLGTVYWLLVVASVVSIAMAHLVFPLGQE
ncbi:MAG: hypothetical protein AB7O67_23620 [Vicinamibacterales bacterium]